MCDEDFEHDLENYSRLPHMTRRQLAAMSMGAGMLLTLPRAADAADVEESDVTESDSPRLLVPKMKSSFLFCVAENDDQRDPTAKDVLCLDTRS